MTTRMAKQFGSTSTRSAAVSAGTVAEWLTMALLAAVLAVVVFEPFGAVRATVIRGSSMGDALPLGSVAISVGAKGDEIEAGDVIVFRQQSGHVVFHRVEAVTMGETGTVARTRGDANGAADANPVSLDGEGSRVVAHIPYMGYAVIALRNPSTMAILAFAGLVAWMVAGDVKAAGWHLGPRRHPRRRAADRRHWYQGVL